ncbi:MAG: hypothetical protein WAM27_08995 [Nitrososphaeraceae archaeon]
MNKLVYPVLVTAFISVVLLSLSPVGFGHGQIAELDNTTNTNMTTSESTSEPSPINQNSEWTPVFVDTPCDLHTGTEGCGESGIVYHNSNNLW